MDTATFFTIVTSLLVLILVIVGIYLVILIHEAHQSLQRLNRILTRFDNLSGFIENNLARPAGNLSSLASLAHDAVRLVNDFKKAVGRLGNEVNNE